ncbi:MAG: PilZ domain-containing protein, partial [Sphingomonadaceae bacterium]
MTLTTEQYIPYSTAAAEDRCVPRITLTIPAMLRQSCANSFAVTISDISLAGFACDAVTGMLPKNRCWLTLPGLSGLEAEVIWNSGSAIGCAFH